MSTKKVSMDFCESAYRALEYLAAERTMDGVNAEYAKAEAIRKSLSDEYFLTKKIRDEGVKVLIRYPSGKEEQVHI